MSEDVAASLPSPASNGTCNGSPAQSPSPTAETPASTFPRPSSSRALVPTPLSASNLNPKVAIATASSPPHDYSNPSPVGGGPTSASYVVPPRPKPGRKPATDEPASKRKAQNRESQRAFRARKAAKLNEMQGQLENSEQRHKHELSEKIAELNEKDIQINKLKDMITHLKQSEERTCSERDWWKERFLTMEDQFKMLEKQLREQPMNGFSDRQSFLQPGMPNSRQDSPNRESITAFTGYNTPKAIDIGCGNCKANGECPCIDEMTKIPPTNPFMAPIPLSQAPPRNSVSPVKRVQAQTTPPTDRYAELEIDFTAQFASKPVRQDTRPSIAFLTQSTEVDSKCGFCTDESNCLCRDESLRVMQSNDILPPTRDWTSDIHNGAKAALNNLTTTGPGSCADCQANPRQRAWCQRVAQLRSSGHSDFLPSPTSRTSSVGSAFDSIEPRVESSRSSVGCSEVYKLLEGRVPMDQDHMDWISNLKPVQPGARRDALPCLEPQRKYSALEIESASIIATLSNSMVPLAPRKSDGQNADLVRIAQEHQRRSHSPRVSSGSTSPSLRGVSGRTWR